MRAFYRPSFFYSYYSDVEHSNERSVMFKINISFWPISFAIAVLFSVLLAISGLKVYVERTQQMKEDAQQQTLEVTYSDEHSSDEP